MEEYQYRVKGEIFMRYSKEMYEENNGAVVYGRVISYNYKRGYGFVRAENGADLLLSTYNLSKNDSRKIVVGALVSFIPELYNDGYTATEVMILDLYPCGKEIVLPNGEKLWFKEIQSYGFKKDKKGIPFIYFARRGGKSSLVYPSHIKQNDVYQKGNIYKYWKDLNQTLTKV